MVQSGGNGNFLSNLHLVGGSVGVNQCKSDDNSWYCQLSRGYSALIMVISIVAICGVLYYFILIRISQTVAINISFLRVFFSFENKLFI